MEKKHYRDFLYASYVSHNKGFQKLQARNVKALHEANLRNLKASLGGWVRELIKSDPVLDVGCGPGNVLRFLKEEGFRELHGVDYSEEQVDIAKRDFPGVRVGDAFKFLEESDGKYGLITAFDLLEHFTRDEAIEFLKRVRNALKPGGVLILQLPNGDSPFAGAMAYGDMTHELIYTVVSLRHLLLASGFEDLKFKEHGPQPLSLPGMVRMLLWKVIRLLIAGVHYVETGGPSTGIYTRVMRVCAKKAR